MKDLLILICKYVLNKYIYFLFLRLPIDVPSGCPRLSLDLTPQPDDMLKERFLNLIHSPDYEGGIFPAFEVPQVLAKDIFEFVEKVQTLKTEL